MLNAKYFISTKLAEKLLNRKVADVYLANIEEEDAELIEAWEQQKALIEEHENNFLMSSEKYDEEYEWINGFADRFQFNEEYCTDLTNYIISKLPASKGDFLPEDENGEVDCVQRNVNFTGLDDNSIVGDLYFTVEGDGNIYFEDFIPHDNKIENFDPGDMCIEEHIEWEDVFFV